LNASGDDAEEHHRQAQCRGHGRLGCADDAGSAGLTEGEIFPPDQQTPEALRTLQKAEIDKWWPIIKELGIKPE
jgi:hypothetical protein